uniref:Uncharacterized protein n=1 Tax=Rhizophora mucronata TaxID=61149 RepID=A0A2P2JEY4_RHIMU
MPMASLIIDTMIGHAPTWRRLLDMEFGLLPRMITGLLHHSFGCTFMIVS